MLSLPEAQRNFVNTINNGPDSLHPELFAGPQDRVLLGLKAHANTISHARLVALEETFPLVRQEMGEAAFNEVSRDYAETDAVRTSDNNKLGQGFAAFLEGQNVGGAIIELAAIEWAWLESYHAAEAIALAAADLGQLDETALLTMPVTLHPSARIVPITMPLASTLDELAAQQPNSILTVRPDAEVRLIPLDILQSALIAMAGQENCTLGNLLAYSLEQAGEQAPLEPILHLIGAGALVKVV